jgi:signal transduction histidine kinase
LELLEQRMADQRSLHLLQNAQGAISRGARLTGSLLAFAHKQRLEPVSADLNSIVIDVTNLLRRSIGDTVEIRHTLASSIWPTLIDTNQIEIALLNVATNARDAMPSGGVLLVETANISAGNKDVPEEVVGQDCVLVSMTDTGIGMSSEVIEHAFEPFFTTKEVGKGTVGRCRGHYAGSARPSTPKRRNETARRFDRDGRCQTVTTLPFWSAALRYGMHGGANRKRRPTCLAPVWEDLI